MTIFFTRVSAEPVEVAVDTFEESERYYLASLVEIISNRESSRAFAPVYRSLAQLYESRQRFRTANVLRREIIRIHELEYGPQHPIVAVDLCDLAISCRHSNETYLANTFYKRGIKLLFSCVVRLQKLRGEEALRIPASLNSVLGCEDHPLTPFGEQAEFIRNGNADDSLLFLAPLFARLIYTSNSNTHLPYAPDEVEELMSGVTRVTQLTKSLKESSTHRHSKRVSA